MGEQAILGIMQLDQRSREYQDQSALINAQIQHMKAQQKTLDTQAELDAQALMMEQQKWGQIQQILGGGGAAPATQEGQQSSVPQQIAAGQVGGYEVDSLDPIKGSIKLKPMETRALKGMRGPNGPVTLQTTKQGIPIPGSEIEEWVEPKFVRIPDKAGNEWQYKMRPDGTPDPSYQPIMVSQAPLQRVDVDTPGGGQATKFINPRAGGKSGGGIANKGAGGGLKTKLDLQDRPMDETTARMYRMPDGSMPTPGATPKDILAAGGRMISAQDAEMEGAVGTTTELVNELEKYALGEGGIFIGVKSGLMDRVGKAAESKMGQLTQSPGKGEKVALYESYKASFAGAMARTVMFERGVLTQPDIERAMRALPIIFPVPDTEEVAKTKFAAIKKFMGKLSRATKRDDVIAGLAELEKAVGGSGKKSLGKPAEAVKKKSKFEIISVEP